MNILKIVVTIIGFIVCMAIIVIALLMIAASHMSMSTIGSKIIKCLAGVFIGLCMIECFITFIDWSYSIGHPWLAVLFFGVVALCFFIITLIEREK